ncbi:Pentatricopeptide repeat-containing protein [Apostasia shenzhenica]|uniref:Pentatricopeptide repeat-containing protein n=1 Tax=Apostasia shenzhenica TaxID=1088818 RepID=A0A2I0BDT0_9ASPA|nr:Pentatricopeptide repeat-containing protein [Apostasia shenzhenica]
MFSGKVFHRLQAMDIFSPFIKNQLVGLLMLRQRCSDSAPSLPNSSQSNKIRALLDAVALGVGSLEEMEIKVEQMNITPTPDLVIQIFNSCKTLPASPGSSSGRSRSRRLLRFFSWCINRSHEGFEDEVFNFAIRAFSEMMDLTAMGIAVSLLLKAGRRMDSATFVLVVETLVKAGKADEAVRLFRMMVERQLIPWVPQGGSRWSSITAVVQALCARGYARKAEGIVWHHREKICEEKEIIYRCLLHGWCIHGDVKEARRTLNEMKSHGTDPGLASYNHLLRCICNRNLKLNPSGIVFEAMDLMTEMRSAGITPNTVSFNILLSCLSRGRRVKEALKILSFMKRREVECSADQVSYYLVVKLLYLTNRIAKGNAIVNQMIEDEVKVSARFFHGLIGVLIGEDDVDCALEIFERMKSYCLENVGSTYDLLIEKLCRDGRFEEGKHLYDEAVEKGIVLQISGDLLDPLKTEVFKPTRSEDKISQRCRMKLLQSRRKSSSRINERNKK